MNNNIVEPLPGVIVTDDDEKALPLRSFHLIVIVEPDPESYLLPPGDLEKFGQYLYEKYELFDIELDPDNPLSIPSTFIDDIEETAVIWLRYSDDFTNLFSKFADMPYTKANFILWDASDMRHFEYYLKGIKEQHPAWRVAVIGAVFEDEVMQIANIISNNGFTTHVLTRYCISNQIFINLDNLIELEQWTRTAGRKEGKEYHSWLDDWLQERGITLEEEDDIEDADSNEEPTEGE